jgi:membrane protein
VFAYWTVLTLGPVLVGVLLGVSGDIDAVVARLAAHPNAAEQAAHAGAAWLGHFVPVLLQVLGFAALYHLIPNRRLRWRHCFAGGAVAGLLLEAMKLGFSIFVSQMSSYGAIYGALAGVPIALLWMYIFWSVALLGAETAAVLTEREVVA